MKFEKFPAQENEPPSPPEKVEEMKEEKLVIFPGMPKEMAERRLAELDRRKKLEKQKGKKL